jgi:serine/threonine kinase 32
MDGRRGRFCALDRQVRVVQHKQSKTLYALKYINKAKCVKMKAVANIVQERRLLEEVRWHKDQLGFQHRAPSVATKLTASTLPSAQIDHPFVVNLRYAFQDDENCFFVLDLMLGGDLRCELTCDCICWHRSNKPHTIRRELNLECFYAVHLDRAGAMNEETVRFYIAELSMAVDYLHQKRIVHR